MIEGYTTIKNIAEQWGMTPRWIQTLCSNGKIPGAVKFGRDWAIPVSYTHLIDDIVFELPGSEGEVQIFSSSVSG